MEKYILMIDDDLDDFIFFNDRLKDFPGYRCHYACDAATGITMMKEHSPFVVLLDMNMPGVNGLECLSAIKSHDDISNIPVIVFSTGISDEQSRAALSYGAVSYMKKPKELDDYDQIIRNIFEVVQQE